ncbi:MAG: sugar-binding transcriptional regulator [Limnochordia bacterium]|jgi:central glycolytic genes regulator|nr:sugar-binding transcriptional regulator [Bacillota bacterium]
MEDTTIIQRVAPELLPILELRYKILRELLFDQPLGRRALASKLQLGERIIRRELERLREGGLVEVGPDGVRLRSTPIIAELGQLVHQLRGLRHLEEGLARELGLRRVVIVPGDLDEDPMVKKDLARATSVYLDKVLKDEDVLAVTGGTTLAEVARSLPLFSSKRRVIVVPARGGLGEEVELQANTVAAVFARQLGGSYRLFHLPDDLPEEAMHTISNEPKVRQIMALLRRADYVLHGIGTAEEMARRRGLGPWQMELIRKRQGVGEAFGYYFDRQGRIVYSTSSTGLRLEDLQGIGEVIAVGGGKSKAEAALAVLSSKYQHVCITDEGAARVMWSLIEGDKRISYTEGR